MSFFRAGQSLQSSLSAMLTQSVLHGQLAWIELAEEKDRAFSMLATMLLGFILLFCSLLSLSALVIIVSWETDYRILTIILLTIAYAAGTAMTWRHYLAVEDRGHKAFSDTRRELGADLDLLRSRLEQ